MIGLTPLEDAGSGPLGPLAPQHWSELIIGVVLVGIIYFVLRKVVVPAFEKMYAERADAIQGGMERAEKAEAEASAALAEYRAKLESARGEASKIREDAKAEAAEYLAEQRRKGTEEAERLVQQARVQIDAERQQAFQQLRGEVGTLATTLAGKIVGETLSDDARAKATVDRFIDELEHSADNQEQPA